MSVDKFIRLNTALKLPDKVAEETIALSCEIAKDNKAVFVLDGIRFHPHITVYSPEYPEKNLDNVLKNTEEIAKSTEKVKLIFEQIDTKQGFIVVGFVFSSEIKRLHERVVEILNPLRESYLKGKYEASDYRMKLSQEKKENIIKYGYPGAMALYNPHLSIIRLEDEFLAEKVAETIKWNAVEFVVDELAVYAMGENGTCKKLVREFALR